MITVAYFNGDKPVDSVNVYGQDGSPLDYLHYASLAPRGYTAGTNQQNGVYLFHRNNPYTVRINVTPVDTGQSGSSATSNADNSKVDRLVDQIQSLQSELNGKQPASANNSTGSASQPTSAGSSGSSATPTSQSSAMTENGGQGNGSETSPNSASQPTSAGSSDSSSTSTGQSSQPNSMNSASGSTDNSSSQQPNAAPQQNSSTGNTGQNPATTDNGNQDNGNETSTGSSDEDEPGDDNDTETGNPDIDNSGVTSQQPAVGTSETSDDLNPDSTTDTDQSTDQSTDSNSGQLPQTGEQRSVNGVKGTALAALGLILGQLGRATVRRRRNLNL